MTNLLDHDFFFEQAFQEIHAQYFRLAPLSKEIIIQIKDIFLKETRPLFPQDKALAFINKKLRGAVVQTEELQDRFIFEEYTPWVEDYWNNKLGRTKRSYWLDYRFYLEHHLRRNVNTIGDLDKRSNEILDHCGNPNDPLRTHWAYRGLVIGQVQSGKTSLYTALINKATDARYKIIIVLTGMMEDLRRQTQERLDNEYVGKKSTDQNFLSPETLATGVRTIIKSARLRAKDDCPNSLTTVENDFNINSKRCMNLSFKNGTFLFVVKKNADILQNLTEWIKNNHGNDIPYPLLLIDDEADNASINTSKPEETPSTINKHIRKLLSLFSRSSYVGFTATPFANILMNSDDDNFRDLFPKDFIFMTDVPEAYFGLEKLVMKYEQEKGALNKDELSDEQWRKLEELPGLSFIEDASKAFPFKHKKNHLPFLNESLKEAIRYYILVNAVFKLKNIKLPKTSMLVHVSRFVNVQVKLHNHIKDYVSNLNSSLYNLSSSLSGTEDENINDFRVTYEKRLAQLSGLSWETVKDHLLEKEDLSSLDIYTQNGDSKPVKHNKALNIIVGGNSLSRGLTLEGLCVSYFYRNCGFYDSLLQMGRWFGYRAEYLKYCHLWLAEDTLRNFADVHVAIKDLEEEIEYMNGHDFKPINFGLKIRQSPSRLKVSNPNKLRHTALKTFTISYNMQLREMTRFAVDALEDNLNAFDSLLKELSKRTADETASSDKAVLFRKVPNSIVVNFLKNYRSHDKDFEFARTGLEHSPLIQWLDGKGARICENFDVAIRGREPQKNMKVFNIAGYNLSPVKRGSRLVKNGNDYIEINGAHLSGPNDESITLDGNLVKEIKKHSEGKSPSRLKYRSELERPLLSIYLCDFTTKTDTGEETTLLDKSAPMLSLSFHKFNDSSRDSLVNYLVNKVWLRTRGSYESNEEE